VQGSRQQNAAADKKDNMANKKIKMKKGQIFSLDLVIAMLAFTVILIASIWLWEYALEKIRSTDERNDLEVISKAALAALVETPGSPSNWTNFSESSFNTSNVLFLGITKSYSISNKDVKGKGKSAGLSNSSYLVLDTAKVVRLTQLNMTKYETMKTLLGILGPNYQFELIISIWNESQYKPSYLIGKNPGNVKANIIKSERLALIDGIWAKVTLKIWRECEDAVC
jgi:hypothetical protein